MRRRDPSGHAQPDRRSLSGAVQGSLPSHQNPVARRGYPAVPSADCSGADPFVTVNEFLLPATARRKRNPKNSERQGRHCADNSGETLPDWRAACVEPLPEGGQTAVRPLHV